MKVTWKPRTGVTGTPVVLGDNTANVQRGQSSRRVVSFRPSYQVAAQVAAYAQAAAAETFGRENLVTEIAIVIDYEFASYGACTKFLAGLGNSLESAGILEIAHTGGGADTLEGCFTSAAVLQQTGSAAVIQYNFVGGAFARGTGNNNQVPQ